MNVQPDVAAGGGLRGGDGADRGRQVGGAEGATHFWGYSLKLPTRDSENVSVKVDDAVEQGRGLAGHDPAAGLARVDYAGREQCDRPPGGSRPGGAAEDQGGYETKVLDQIVINLEVPNNLAFTDTVHCRVLLTTTLETTTVGNTILISKGLLDTLPNEPAFASVIAMELAHIALGHHIDTRYAFNDRLLFPDEASFQRINMYHSD